LSSCRFSPAIRSGVPVADKITIDFKLPPPPVNDPEVASRFPREGGLETCDTRLLTYPIEARRRSEQGTTVLTLYVDSAGSVTQSEIFSSSGFAVLDKATQQFFESCRFKPVVKDGVPVPSVRSMRQVWRLAP
jgi:TonB family protein